MTTSIHFALISRQELEKLSREHIHLKPGDKLEGEVMEIRKDGKAVVDFGRFQAALELKVPVEKGDVISVKVESAEKGKQIKLKLEEVKTKTNIPPDVQKTIKQTESIRNRPTEEILRREIDAALEQLPDKSRSSMDVRELLKDIETSLNKISDYSYPAGQDAPTDDIEALLGNIKIALGQLKNNIQTGQNQFELPPELKDILTNLQLDFNQVTQMFEKHAGQTALAETLEKAKNIPGEAKDIFSKLPRSLQTPGNMTHLSEIIRHLDSTSTLPEQIRPMLSILRSHFEPLDIGQGAVKLVPKLKAVVEESGIFFEKKIQDVISRLSEASTRIGAIDNLNRLPEIRDIINNDLKPNLLQFREYLNSEKLETLSNGREPLEIIRKSVEDLLDNINTQQNRAVETQTRQQPVMVFTFNLPIKGEQDAQLKVFYNRGKKREEDGEFKLSLLLNMDRLGEIRTDFSHWEDNLTVTFFVGTYKIKEYIEENLDEIKGPLEAEFKSLNFNVMVSEEQIAAFAGELTTPGIISDKTVDVKV